MLKILLKLLHLLLYIFIPTGFLVYYYSINFNNDETSLLVRISFSFAFLLYLIVSPIIVWSNFPKKPIKILLLFVPYLLNGLFFVIRPFNSGQFVENLFIQNSAVMASIALGLVLLVLIEPYSKTMTNLQYIKKHPETLIGLVVLAIPFVSIVFLLFQSWHLLQGPAAINFSQLYFLFMLANTSIIFYKSMK
jgi:hypothetical protein